PEMNQIVKPSAAFTANGRLVALAAGLHAWDAATWEPLPDLWEPGGGKHAHVMAPEPGGHRVALGNGLIIDVVNGRVLGRWGPRLEGFWVRGSEHFAWCPRRTLVAFRSYGNVIDVVDLEDGKLVVRITGTSKKFFEALTFAPDGSHLIAVSNDKVARF